MTRTEQKHLKTGKGLIQRNKSVADYARAKTLEGITDPYQRALANLYIDYQEGKITKEEWEALSAAATKS